jgi:hypothetical protein
MAVGPSGGWRQVYREMGVPMTPRESGAVEDSNRQQEMGQDTSGTTEAPNTRDRVSREMAAAHLDSVADRLVTADASEDTDQLRQTVLECRAELQAVESILADTAE